MIIMIDTEIKLRGSAAKEFHKMMTSMDIDSLHARDKFISNLNYAVDENGILSIDISDLDIDLSVMQNAPCTIDVSPVSKPEKYVETITVNFISSVNISSNIDIICKKNTSYKIEKYHKSTMHSANQIVSIDYAA